MINICANNNGLSVGESLYIKKELVYKNSYAMVEICENYHRYQQFKVDTNKYDYGRIKYKKCV